jgi:hypothetical protein
MQRGLPTLFPIPLIHYAPARAERGSRVSNRAEFAGVVQRAQATPARRTQNDRDNRSSNAYLKLKTNSPQISLCTEVESVYLFKW